VNGNRAKAVRQQLRAAGETASRKEWRELKRRYDKLPLGTARAGWCPVDALRQIRDDRRAALTRASVAKARELRRSNPALFHKLLRQAKGGDQ